MAVRTADNSQAVTNGRPGLRDTSLESYGARYVPLRPAGREPAVGRA